MEKETTKNRQEPGKLRGGVKKAFQRSGNRKNAGETRNGDRKALLAVVAIGAAVTVFVILTIIQNNLVNNVDRTGVVVALVDVPAGIVLTEENIPDYFGMESRPSADIPAGYYTSGHALVGRVTSREIKAKEIVTASGIVGEDFYAGMEDPVEISIAADKIGQVVGGSLRAGDIVDIKVVIDLSSYYGKNETEEETPEGEAGILEPVTDTGTDTEPDVAAEGGAEAEESLDSGDGSQETGAAGTEPELPEGFLETDTAGELLWELPGLSEGSDLAYSVTGRYASVTVCEGVRVVNVYTSAGLDTAAAEADGSAQVATVINVVVPRHMEDDIFLALEEGTLRISRVVDRAEAEETSGSVPEAEGSTTAVGEESREPETAGSTAEGTTEDATESTAEGAGQEQP